MNKFNFLKSMIPFLAVAILLGACGKTTSTSDQPAAEQKDSEAMKAVLTGYYDVKNALVSDDAAKAKEAATSLATITGAHADQLNAHLETIASTDDIEVQRQAFETLSMNVYELSKNGGNGLTLYKQYCPMAFDDKGAFWLSSSKEVLNPYFGASMLRCGSVKEEIK